MNFKTFLESMSTQALDVLDGFDYEAAIEAGVDPTRARAWRQLHDIYFGPTKSRQKQRLATEKARRYGFSLDQLAMIERRLRPIKSARTRTKLRLVLLDTKGTYKKLSERAKALLPNNTKHQNDRLTFSPSRNGRRTMTLTTNERDLADLEHALTQDMDPKTPPTKHMLRRFLDIIRGDGRSVPHAVPRPLLLIPLPQWIQIQRGHGDETTLTLTDGTTMTGAEYLNSHVATTKNELEAAVFHPQHGAVNLYRTQRLANDKQRALARAVTPGCPVPGCRHAADACEIHHITAWQHGGETNINNLSPLCRYHNRVNDDEPQRARRGRIEIVDAQPLWHSPRGYSAPNPVHRPGAMKMLYT